MHGLLQLPFQSLSQSADKVELLLDEVLHGLNRSSGQLRVYCYIFLQQHRIFVLPYIVEHLKVIFVLFLFLVLLLFFQAPHPTLLVEKFQMQVKQPIQVFHLLIVEVGHCIFADTPVPLYDLGLMQEPD